MNYFNSEEKKNISYITSHDVISSPEKDMHGNRMKPEKIYLKPKFKKYLIDRTREPT